MDSTAPAPALRGVSFVEIGAVVPHLLRRHGQTAEVKVRSRSTIIDDAEASTLLTEYDFVILPLTMPNFGAVRLAEMAHILGSSTRVILNSSTDLPRESLLGLFDAFIKAPTGEIEEFISALTGPVTRSTNNLSERVTAVLRANCFGGRHGGGTTLDVYRAVTTKTPEQREAREPEQPVTLPEAHTSPWRSGSFYLFAAILSLIAIAAMTQLVSSWLVPVVVIGALLFIVIVGAFQLRHDDRLGEKTFLQLLLESLKKMPLLRTKR